MVWKKYRTRIAIYDGRVRAYLAGLTSLFSVFFPIILLSITLFLGCHFLYSAFFITSYEIAFERWCDDDVRIALETKSEKAFANGLYFWQVPHFCAQLKKKYALIDSISFSIDQNRKCRCTIFGPEFLCQINETFLLSKQGILYEQKTQKNLDIKAFPLVEIDQLNLLEKEYVALAAPLSLFLPHKEWKVHVKSLSEIFLVSSDEKKTYCFLYDCNVTNSTFLSMPTDVDALLKAKNISLKKGEQWVFDMRFGSYIVVGKTKKGGKLL